MKSKFNSAQLAKAKDLYYDHPGSLCLVPFFNGADFGADYERARAEELVKANKDLLAFIQDFIAREYELNSYTVKGLFSNLAKALTAYESEQE